MSKHSIENFLYKALSDKWCGNDMMPLNHRVLRFRAQSGVDYVVSFQNDAFELGFGYPDEWKMFIGRKDFHKIMRWYIKNWAWGEWFGLRRYLWYKLLRRKVARTTAWQKEQIALINQQIKSVLDELEDEAEAFERTSKERDGLTHFAVPLSTIQKIRSRYE